MITMGRVSAKKGFTLIELLVVIAIIALLLSVIMPALGKAKKAAKSLVCRSQLRQMQLASTMYNQANDGDMYWYDAYASGTVWISNMEPFIGDTDAVRYCPSTKVDPDQGGSSKYAWHWGEEAGSYAINGYIYKDNENDVLANFWPPGEFEAHAYQSLDTVTNSGNTPTFFDCAWLDRWPKDTDEIDALHDLDDPRNTATSHMSLMMMNRHGKAGNVSFVDGHAEAVELSDFWSLKWHRKFEIKHDMKRRDDSPIYQP
ncbi:MAG: prepilin-type N-terminal cleavage/methylation domain-containing protein [Planctomycetota bacterium]